MKTLGINIDEIKGMTDAEIRTFTIKSMKGYNGEYIFSVCRKCGIVRTSPESNSDQMEIVDRCSRCFDK